MQSRRITNTASSQLSGALCHPWTGTEGPSAFADNSSSERRGKSTLDGEEGQRPCGHAGARVQRVGSRKRGLSIFDLYPPSRIVLPETPPEHLKRLLPAALNYDYGPPEPRLSDREKQEFIAAYYACTICVDAQVGVLLDTLDELDLWRKTIVVFVSDHGYHLADHGGLWHKNSLGKIRRNW